jgi:hypothetical protein
MKLLFHASLLCLGPTLVLWGTGRMGSDVAGIVLGVIVAIVFADRARRPKPTEEDMLRDMLGQIASGTRDFWDSEAGSRRLRSHLIDTELLTGVSTRHPHDPDSVDEEDNFSGVVSSVLGAEQRRISISTMASEWRDDPIKRFVILGRPGSGKTSLMVNLLRTILRDRAPHELEPVPVLVSASGWDPETPFHQWFKDVLERDHPALRRPWKTGGDEWTCSFAEGLMREGLIIPFLDGLDEIPAEGDRRRKAIERLDTDELYCDLPLVVSCRIDDYAPNTGADGDGDARLSGVQEYRMQDLSWQQAAAYLCGSPLAEDQPSRIPARWRTLVDELEASARRARPSPIAEAFSTPLIVHLARVVYARRNNRTPDELLGFGSRADIEAHLAGRYLEAMYRAPSRRIALHDDEIRSRTALLAYLAKHLEERGTTDFEWWKLYPPRDPEDFDKPMISAGMYVPRTFDHEDGWILPQEPNSGLLMGGLWIGTAMVATFMAVVLPFSPDATTIVQMAFRALAIYAVVLAFMSVVSVQTVDSSRSSPLGPYQIYKAADRANIVESAMVTGILMVLAVGCGVEGFLPLDLSGWGSLLYYLPVMAGGMAFFTMQVGIGGTSASLRSHVHQMQQTGILPASVPFMETLEDARERQILRQVGGIYQFRHRIIQEYLATR